MIGQLIVRNVFHRPIRTAVSVLAVGVEVMLVVIVVGLTSGLLQDTAKRVEGVGADIMLRPPASGMLMAFSGAPMPITIRGKLEELKYVQAVAPVLLQFNRFTVVLGIASLVIVVIYPFMKRVTNMPQFVLGLAFSWGALLAWSAVFGRLDAPAYLAYAAATAACRTSRFSSGLPSSPVAGPARYRRRSSPGCCPWSRREARLMIACLIASSPAVALCSR